MKKRGNKKKKKKEKKTNKDAKRELHSFFLATECEHLRLNSLNHCMWFFRTFLDFFFFFVVAEVHCNTREKLVTKLLQMAGKINLTLSY